MDGLPAAARDEANRLVLDQQLDELKAGNARGSGMTAEEYNAREQTLMKLKDQLDVHDTAVEDKRVFLLGLDAKAYGGDGKVIVAVGNPDTADHTAVLVPGTGTTIDSTGGQLTRANDLQEAAKQASKGTNQKVSVISWLGYDAPEVPVVQAPNLSVAWDARANDGAEALRQFTQGTRVAQGDHPSHLSVFGHSYGTTLVGAAAAGGGGLGADEIVAVASPGLTVDRADQLHIDPSHFWTGRAADDNIAMAAGYTLGADPVDDEFGGQRFEVDTSGHSGYWDDGSKSLDNQGRIIVGKTPTTLPRLTVNPPGPL